MRSIQLAYMYRDASNYKSHHAVILPTALTDEEVNTALTALRICGSDDEFVPEDVGLHSLVPDNVNDDDHCLHELVFDEIQIVDRKPDREILFEDFAARFIVLDVHNDWNYYDPAPDEDGLSGEYEGPGWVPPTNEEKEFFWRLATLHSSQDNRPA